MDIEFAKRSFEAGTLTEVTLEPADEGNGWMVVLHDNMGGSIKLSDHSGVEKVFHSIEHATELAQEIGFDTVRVEERF